MKIGCPKEIKPQEFRVGMTPDAVREAVAHGHQVLVETAAGMGAGFSDADYSAAGAQIAATAEEVFATAEMIVKVKEPQAVERARLRAGQLLFTYLHLAPDPDQTRDLLASGVTAIAYETVTGPNGRGLPLLAPMSEIAGRLSIQVGGAYLLKHLGGRGRLIGGSPGVEPARVVVLGGGVAGTNAVAMAVGLGADVTVLDTNLQRLRELDALYAGRVKTIASNGYEIDKAVVAADLVVGSVLVPGAKAPKLVSNELVSRMKPGSVLVDIAVDQGGCFADTRPTTHADPTFLVHGSIFYCVANMPGAVPATSTYALTNATLPYVRAIANHGWRDALRADAALALGLNTHAGEATNAAVGEAHGLASVALDDVLA